MIPIRDNIPSRTYPVVTILLIWINFMVFALELSQGHHLQQFIAQWGLVPSRFVHYGPLSGQFVTIFTSMFMHGGWLHILGNMWFLYLFGDNVEDRLGHGRYFAFYLICGVASAFADIYVNPGSSIPTIGASGAIAGVLGAYILLFPLARVATLIWIFIIFWVIEVPAALFIGAWFLLQFIPGLESLFVGGQQHGGIAWWAHVGGFIMGMILVKLLCPDRGHCRYPHDVMPNR